MDQLQSLPPKTTGQQLVGTGWSLHHKSAVPDCSGSSFLQILVVCHASHRDTKFLLLTWHRLAPQRELALYNMGCAFYLSQLTCRFRGWMCVTSVSGSPLSYTNTVCAFSLVWWERRAILHIKTSQWQCLDKRTMYACVKYNMLQKKWHRNLDENSSTCYFRAKTVTLFTWEPKCFSGNRNFGSTFFMVPTMCDRESTACTVGRLGRFYFVRFQNKVFFTCPS